MTRDELRTKLTGQPAPYPDFLVIGAFRYALGRETYVTHETASWLIANWGALSANAQAVIGRDLVKAFEEDNHARASGSKYKPLGADCDRESWWKLVEYLQK